METIISIIGGALVMICITLGLAHVFSGAPFII